MKLNNYEGQSLICRLIRLSVDLKPGKFCEAKSLIDRKTSAQVRKPSLETCSEEAHYFQKTLYGALHGCIILAWAEAVGAMLHKSTTACASQQRWGEASLDRKQSSWCDLTRRKMMTAGGLNKAYDRVAVEAELHMLPVCCLTESRTHFLVNTKCWAASSLTHLQETFVGESIKESNCPCTMMKNVGPG